MDLENISFTGPDFDEASPVVALLPKSISALLRQVNGFIQYSGGFHLRGVCSSPTWHSLEEVMSGAQALHKLYPVLIESDIPFAQDCMADQFILRDEVVHKLWAETGELESLGVGLKEFFAAIEKDAVEFLGMHPLMQLRNEGKFLELGQVIHAYPPFCTSQAQNGVSLKPVPAHEALIYLSEFAKQIQDVPEGGKIHVVVTSERG